MEYMEEYMEYMEESIIDLCNRGKDSKMKKVYNMVKKGMRPPHS